MTELRMTRSKKKHPITGITCAESEKDDKRLANRKFRMAVKRAIKKGAEVLPHKREVSNVWSFAKDGKEYVDKKSPYHKKVVRK